jgi:hypothetical protein
VTKRPREDASSHELDPRPPTATILPLVLAGLAATAIVQSRLGVVSGDWWSNAAALTLTVAAGILVAAPTMVLVGNPFSAVASGPELLPRPASTSRWAPAGVGAPALPCCGGDAPVRLR